MRQKIQIKITGTNIESVKSDFLSFLEDCFSDFQVSFQKTNETEYNIIAEERMED